MSSQDVLVLAEVQRGALADVTLELLSAARGIVAAAGGDVVAVVLSGQGAAYAAQLGGADRIVLVDDSQLASYAPAPYVAALAEVVAAEKPKALLIAGTSIGWDLAPLLSARLNVPFVTGCKAVRAEGAGLLVTASFCGGKMTADVEVSAAPAILMVLPGSFRPTAEAGKARIETRPVAAALESGASASRNSSSPRPATWTLPSRRSWLPWGGESSRRTISSWPRSWPRRWAAWFPPRGRWSIRVGCRPRGRWASPG